MRGQNRVRSARAQLSLSENTDRILQQVADIGILGKTRAEVAGRIITDWVWQNEERLLRQGIKLSNKLSEKSKATQNTKRSSK